MDNNTMVAVVFIALLVFIAFMAVALLRAGKSADNDITEMLATMEIAASLLDGSNPAVSARLRATIDKIEGGESWK